MRNILKKENKFTFNIQKKFDVYTHNSHPKVSLSLVEITGRTRLSDGISETRENKNMAASKDWKNIRAPAKKKFPILEK